MRLAIFSDIHANLPAMESFVERVRALGIDGCVCLGDVVGYGASPNECCQIVREVSSVTLLGNHDAAVIGVMDTDFYYPAAKHVLYWTRTTLDAENLRWLYALPYTYRMENILFFHAAPIMPSGFFYVVREDDARAHTRVFDQLAALNFIGHSHLTAQYRLSAQGVTDLTGNEIRIEPGYKYLINVGSVGQPRDRNPNGCFGVLDTKAGRYWTERFEYDVEGAAKRIRAAGLDDKFADRLFSGT